MKTGLIRLGTSAFTAAGWPGSFYPANLRPAEYLTFYATQFDTVEADSTFYRAPSVNTVRAGMRRRRQVSCSRRNSRRRSRTKKCWWLRRGVSAFLTAMDLLGEKLGPLLLQFPWFPDTAFLELDDFLARLLPFLDRLPRDTASPWRFAIGTGWCQSWRTRYASEASPWR